MSASHKAEPVVVIGANEFVGRRVVEVLANADGLRPIAAARTPGNLAGIEWRRCNATSHAALEAALAGAVHVVNCFAGSAASMVAVTQHLCQAARRLGIRRIVHLSSMAVYGRAIGLVDESHALDDTAGPYARARVACEALLREAAQGGADAVILRPGCIHGPGSEHWTARIGRLLRRHRIGDLGEAGDGLCNIVHVDDVAAAILAVLRTPGLGGEAFNVADPDPGTWNAYFMAFGRAIGATPVRRVSPRWLALEGKAVAIPLKLAQIAAARANLAHLVPDPITGSMLALWRQDIQLDHRRADACLSFPRTPPEAALASAAAWFRTQG